MQGEIKYVDRIAQGAGARRRIGAPRAGAGDQAKVWSKADVFGRIEAFDVACRNDTGVALS